jgi:signal transduction histidine kinase
VPAAVLVVALSSSLVDRLLRRRGDQLRALAGQLQSAREEERAGLAREIHDELGSALTGLKWELESLGDRRLGGAIRRVESIMRTVKQISSDLRPGILDDLGLFDAIQWGAAQFERRTGIVCACELPEQNAPLSNEAATAAFRIFQEALTNVLRHASATRVDVHARIARGQLLLDISDNGRGMSRRDLVSPQSLGLLGMRERAALVDGTVDITSQPGRGTRLSVAIPLSTKVAA